MKGDILFLLQIYKALEELNEADRVARKHGIILVQDTSDGNAPVKMGEAKLELETIGRVLMLGHDFMNSSGYKDHRKAGYIIIEKLCHVLGAFKDTIKKFEQLGLAMNGNTFYGHFHASMAASRKALELLCGISLEQEKFHEIWDEVSVHYTDYSRTASCIFHMDNGKYAENAIKNTDFIGNATSGSEDTGIITQPEGPVTAEGQRHFDVQTPHGTIRANAIEVDGDNPGIALFFLGKNGTEHSSCIMEYTEAKDAVTLAVWSPQDRDGDAVAEYCME